MAQDTTLAAIALTSGHCHETRWIVCFVRYLGSCSEFVKRGGVEVLHYFPAHGREGEAAPLLRRNLLMLLVQVAILMASRTLAKNRKSRPISSVRK